MGIQYGWYIPRHVIYVNFYNRVTVDEFISMNQRLEKMIARSQTNMIHIIQDEGNIKSAPPQFGSLIDHSVIARGKINGWVVTISKDSEHNVMKFISTAFARIGNTRHERFYHLEEAEAYLEAVDPDLNFYDARRNFLERTLSREEFIKSAMFSS